MSSRTLGRENTAVAFAPASLSNLGPGFDSLGIALGHWHDRVEIQLHADANISVTFDPNGAWTGPTGPQKNTAAVAAQHVANRLKYTSGFHITIKKGIRAGSGLGSSAASAVAGAVAMNAALGAPLPKYQLIESCMEGESIVSGARHGDNVVPALMGGMVLVESGNPSFHQKIASTLDVHFAVVLPEVEILTEKARSILPSTISLKEGSVWASRLAQLVLSLRDGDTARFGQIIMTDEIVEPIRASLLPPYAEIKKVVLDSGALGCALSGSGPAMFAVCSSEEKAFLVVQAMQNVCSDFKIECLSMVDRINNRGAFAE